VPGATQGSLASERDKRGRLEGDDRLLEIPAKRLRDSPPGWHSAAGWAESCGELTRSKRVGAHPMGFCSTDPGRGQAGTSRSQHAPNGVFHVGHGRGRERGHTGGTCSLPGSRSLSLCGSRV